MVVTGLLLFSLDLLNRLLWLCLLMLSVFELVCNFKLNAVPIVQSLLVWWVWNVGSWMLLLWLSSVDVHSSEVSEDLRHFFLFLTPVLIKLSITIVVLLTSKPVSMNVLKDQIRMTWWSLSCVVTAEQNVSLLTPLSSTTDSTSVSSS